MSVHYAMSIPRPGLIEHNVIAYIKNSRPQREFRVGHIVRDLVTFYRHHTGEWEHGSGPLAKAIAREIRRLELDGKVKLTRDPAGVAYVAMAD